VSDHHFERHAGGLPISRQTNYVFETTTYDMTLEEFTDTTISVVREDGIGEYLPTLAYPETKQFRVIQGIPEGVDHREAIQNVIRRSGGDQREFFFGVRSAPKRITTGHFRPGRPTEFMEVFETPEGYATAAIEACGWWTVL
jgi:hypothetical protein